MRQNRLFNTTALAAGCLSLFAVNPAIAQDEADSMMEIEEVVVTGTYLKGKSQFNSPSPIAVIGSENLNQIGASNVADLVQTLTINSGAQNNPDAFTQNGTSGTSNFNLRGLGVASTLVLLNGRRQVVAGTTTNDGIAFVDTSSLVPQIAVQRIEIVKDGAAAIYGTDAVAGVVNFITDDQFEGVKVSAKYQTLTDQGSQSDQLYEAKFGFGGENTHFMGAFSYYDRSPLTTAERRFSLTADDSSVLGNPGSYYVPSIIGLIGITAPVIDPYACEEVGGIPDVAVPLPNGLNVGTCGFDFGDYYSLVPEEERKQAYAVVTQDLGDGHQLRFEGGWAETGAIRNNSPTFPYLQLGSAGVPDYHPENPFGEGVSFLGRAIGNGGEASPNRFASETYRFNIELTGDFNENWSYDFGVTHARNKYQIATADTITNNFQRALIGYGACDAEIGSVAPGTAGCEFYNPFATSFSTAPNSAAIMDYIIGEQVIDGTSKTTVYDAVVSGTVGSTGAGDIGLALGIQIRDEFWGRDYDDISNSDGFAFVIGNSDFGDERTAVGIFAESLIPITDQLDLSLALRHEAYGGDIGSTTDPKISLLYRPSDKMALRGSFSTSFRAPSVLQVSGGGTSLNQVTDPLGGTAFAAVRSVAPEGGREIVPEQGKAWNFGFTWEPVDGLDLDVDFWNYTFTDVIIQENYQAVVNADPTDTSRVIRSAGTSGSIIMVIVDYLNASKVTTQGFDVSAKYNIDTDMGTFMPFFEATHVLKYDLEDPQAGSIDGAGNRNFANFGSPTPAWRLNTGMAWGNENHDARFYVRHISGMNDDQTPGNSVGAMTTVDAQYTLQLSAFSDSMEGSSLQFGVINAFDKAPPYVSTNGGYESRTHDPRGRMVYAKFVAQF